MSVRIRLARACTKKRPVYRIVATDSREPRDGKFLAKVPEQAKNPFGRPIFQNLQYSDTPTQPLVAMRYTDTNSASGQTHTYRVIAVNTVGLKSTPSAE